jgi:glutamate carboxypeptidase
MCAIAAYRRIARTPAHAADHLPVPPDEEVSSPASRSFIEREARSYRCVLVTEPARDGGKIVTAQGHGAFIVRTRGRPAHSGSIPRRAATRLPPWPSHCRDRAHE